MRKHIFYKLAHRIIPGEELYYAESVDQEDELHYGEPDLIAAAHWLGIMDWDPEDLALRYLIANVCDGTHTKEITLSLDTLREIEERGKAGKPIPDTMRGNLFHTLTLYDI